MTYNIDRKGKEEEEPVNIEKANHTEEKKKQDLDRYMLLSIM